MKINVLDARVYNRISAGEVVERPSSIVKELVENSIDAGAKNIRVEIEEGGIKNITVIDDGCGIEKDDLTVAFLPHATSKIKDVEDLDNISSLGFRGEALASISSVCQVKLSSKTHDSALGYSIKVNGGVFEDVVEVAKSDGTTISCSNIFFNTPVRAKFLRKPKTEESEVTHLIERFMLSNSNIAFQYYVDGKQVYNTTSCSMQDIIYTIYGRDVYENLIEIKYEEDGFKIGGFVTKPKISKSNRTYQTLFVNGRCVENFLISNAVQGVYESFLMKGRFPVYVLSILLPADCVDVNVHPSKKEVKFDNPNKMFSMVRRAVEKALLSVDQIQNFLSSSAKQEDSFDNNQDINKFMSNLSEQIDKTQINGERNLDLKNIPSNKFSYDPNTVEKPKTPLGGKSFSIDFFDKDEQIIDPKEFEIEVNKMAKEQEKGINTNSEETAFKDLENLSIKDRYNINKDDTTFFFDQTGEKFTRDIQKESEQKFLKASVKDEMKILGTLFKTYIVIELDDAVYFIDQHAAHERLLYDRLVKAVDSGEKIIKQDLLAPYSFNVGAKESQSIDLMLDDLKKLGFELEKDGYKYTITSVPYILSYIELDKFVDEIIKEGIGWDKKKSDFIHSKLCQTACKHAIKAGDEITKDECAYIIEEVRKGVMLCPHGRPITLVITKHEFEKMFKRIV